MLMMSKDKQIIFHLRTLCLALRIWKREGVRKFNRRENIMKTARFAVDLNVVDWKTLAPYGSCSYPSHYNSIYISQINTQFASVIASKCFNLIWVKDWKSQVASEPNWIKNVNKFICCSKLCSRYMDEDFFLDGDILAVSVISFLKHLNDR